MEHLHVGSPDPNTNGCESGSGACIITITEETDRSLRIGKDEAWLARKMRSTSDRWTSMKPRIPKVPQALRDIEDHSKCFDPVVLSIGPYHHGKPELEMVQNLKIACAQQFVSDYDLNNFCSMVEDVATTARDYYDLSTIDQRLSNDEEFAWMMFLDGCFILHFIDCCINDTCSELDKHINILSLIWRDLFLLENQLPYVVLKALMSFKYTEARWQKMVEEWINAIVSPQGFYSSEDGGDKLHPFDFFRTKSIGDGGDDQRHTLFNVAVLRCSEESYDQQHVYQSIEDGGDDQQQPLLHIDTSFCGDDQQPRHHLLDFVRTEESNSNVHFLKTHSFGDNQEPQLHQSIGDGGDDQQQPLHLLDLLWTRLVGSRDNAHTSSLSRSEFLKWRSYPSINELIAVGINIKRSNTSCLNDIHFRPTLFGGELLLPQMVIGNYTRERFLNLVAYEMGKDTHDFAVSSYLCFMDTLVDDADDVKMLRSKRILYNWLGTNEQVADHFNKLAVGLVPDAYAYSEVIRGIDKYYKSKIKVSIGEFVHSHFSGPWSIIATIAAGITILLTFFQTISSLLSVS